MKKPLGRSALERARVEQNVFSVIKKRPGGGVFEQTLIGSNIIHQTLPAKTFNRKRGCMRKYSLLLCFLLLLGAGAARAQLDTLRIASYNLLFFPSSQGVARLPNFRTVINALQPDLLLVQELESEQGQLLFLNQVMNFSQSHLYQSAPFVDGFDLDNTLYYKPAKVTLLGTQQIRTSLRNISEYYLQANGVEFRLYSAHLKAGSEVNDERQRANEALTLRTYLNELRPEENLVAMGDFNLSRSSESAFLRLTESQSDNDGRLFDPLNAVGVWNNNASFAALHTQSTRTTVFGDGSAGGLDDRFDLILVSASVLTPNGMYLLPNSYRAFGNDGNHFNRAINAGANGVVAASVANALHEASDHLPVFADFVVGNQTAVQQRPRAERPALFELEQNFPNPFNPETVIGYRLQRRAWVTLKLYDLTGAEVATLVNETKAPGHHRARLAARGLKSGVYFYRLVADGQTQTRKLVYME
ncbi:MAG: hypothetical protein DKINENOH_02915 [bacterium]|nr:hypothetical protein [bacterium]